MSSQNEEKQQAAYQALDFIEVGCLLGVGTGSTAQFFMDALPRIKGKIEACVSSSEATTHYLKRLNLPVVDFNTLPFLDVYVDGADEVDPFKNLIKGGGGALTFEKILASAAKNFVCIVDSSKCVESLGRFPLPIEVLPMARSAVARALVKLTGGQPLLREGYRTDSGNLILDVLNLHLSGDLVALEQAIQLIPGVVEVGLFAVRQPNHLLIGGL